MTVIPSLSSALRPRPASTAPADTTELAASRRVRVLACRCAEEPALPESAGTYAGLTLVVAREGAFTYQERGYTRLVEPGTVLLGCAGDAYACHHDYGGGDACTVFQFSDEWLDEFQAASGRAVLPQAAVFALSPRLAAAALPALTAEAPAAAVEEAAHRLAAAAFDELSGNALEVPPSWRRLDRDRAHDAARLIEARASEPLELEALAAALHLSPFHFLRLFRRELGLTPHQYLVRTRLRHAMALLRESDASVTAIAQQAGFGDLSHFIRTFRREIGCSPSVFRRGA